jgi:membrane-associated protein
MDGIIDFLKELVNPESIILYGGIYLLLFVVFAETGLFFGFFLPGDSLLFTAGLFCSTGILKIHPVTLAALIIIAAVTGNMFGYYFGKKWVYCYSSANQVYSFGRHSSYCQRVLH